jgi:hypothetical protein
MIEWLTWVWTTIAVVAGLVGVVLGLAGRKPDDITLGATVLVELTLVIQVVVSIVAPFVGNHATGSTLEFWIYLVSAALIPPLAVLWGLIERNRWSTVVLGVACLAVAVMLYRMHQIWFVQTA